MGQARAAILNLKKGKSYRLLVIVLLTKLTILKVYAQDDFRYTNHIPFYNEPPPFYTYFGFSASYGLAHPVSFAKIQLKGIYQSSPTFNFSFLRYFGDFSLGLSAGYSSFKPLISAYPFEFSPVNFGTYNYHHYATLMISVNTMYNLRITKRLSAFGGVNFGRYYTKYGLSLVNSQQTFNVPLRDSGYYLAPKLGIGFKITYYLQVNLQRTESYFFSVVNIKGETDLNKTYKYWDNSAALIIRFP